MDPANPLNRIGCALLLAVLGGPACAAWVVVNDHDDYVAYADPATIARSGDTARMRDMIDLKASRRSPYGVPHLSSQAHSEFDCQEPRVRTLAFALHAEPMGNGAVVEVVKTSPHWMPVFNGTLLEMLRRLACG
jgi:hypothetical protein